MNFRSYMHIEKLGREEVDGILVGVCDIFPKLDGSNGLVWWDEDGLQCGSRKRHLMDDEDNHGFKEHIMWQSQFMDYFRVHPDVILYGEWLVPHTLKTYRKEMWRKFYVFDVLHDEAYIPYAAYAPELERYDINFIPRIAQVKNPTEDKLVQIMQDERWGIKDGEGIGEGIVIKNYNFTNRYDRVTWAKLVSTDFTDKHRKEMGEPQIEMSPVEDKIAALLTPSLVNKIYTEIDLIEPDGFQNRHIPRLISTVWHDFIIEKLWIAIKKFKNPTINFRMLQHHVVDRTKKLKPEAF